MKCLTLLRVLCLSTVFATAPALSKTLVFCSEGSPENFYPGINTTGTSFDGSDEIYNKIVAFEPGGTKVVPSLAEFLGDFAGRPDLHLQAAPQRQMAQHRCVQADP